MNLTKFRKFELFRINVMSAYIYEDAIQAKQQGNAVKSSYDFPLEKDENGYIQFNMDLSNTEHNKFIRFPLISAWPNNIDAEKTELAKAILAIPQEPKTGWTSHDEEKKLLNEVCKECWRRGGITYGHPQFMFSIDRFFRFGYWKSAENLLSSYSNDRDSPSSIPIYDNKNQCFVDILDIIKRGVGNQQVVGLDLINLNVLSEKILVELGFVRVDDLIGNGQPMWQGDPHALLSGGKDSYSMRRYSRSSTSVDSQVLDSFLKLIEEDLSKVSSRNRIMKNENEDVVTV